MEGCQARSLSSLQHDLGVGEVAGRQDGQKALVGFRKVGGRHVDHRVGTANERFTHEARLMTKIEFLMAVSSNHKHCLILPESGCVGG